MTRQEQVDAFDVNGSGIPGQLFGLPFDATDSQIVIIPVPWEATVSYRTGTALAPTAILQASQQIDIYHPHIPNGWKLGMAMLPIPTQILEESNQLRMLMDKRSQSNDDILITKINERCENLNVYVKNMALQWLNQEKTVGLVGGDHSTPLGLIRALSEKHDRFGILQIDAHADLRKAYEGLTYSHGSVMYNALKIPAIGKLVQVGVRDYCEEEVQNIAKVSPRVKTFFGELLNERKDNGESWRAICKGIVNELPDDVYVSLDVDGLDPSLCPNTGTPVPGGLQFDEVVTLIRTIVESKRRIIAFDLNEVSGNLQNPWDAIVGARLLWQLCHWTAVSQGKLSVSPK